MEIEKDNSDRLLKNILPEPIAQRLKTSVNKTIADKFENVAVLFADIVEFTELADDFSPEEKEEQVTEAEQIMKEEKEKLDAQAETNAKKLEEAKNSTLIEDTEEESTP